MSWAVQFPADFAREADALSQAVRVELIGAVRLLEQFGPGLGRPTADTLNGSKHANMKELRQRRRVAHRLRVRSSAQGRPACRRRQVGHGVRRFPQGVDQTRRCSI